MRYLFDTHALLWAVGDTDRLSETARHILASEPEVCTSIAALWEIGIKKSIGKLRVPFSLTELADCCRSQRIMILPIHPAHIDALGQLPNIHGDPFDRLLIAQAWTEGLTIVTKDEKIRRYPVETQW